MRQSGLFGLSDHMKRLSAYGDPLDVLARVVDFEAFRPTLMSALAYSDGAKGGRLPYDPVVMLKVLVLAAQNNVADARMKWLIRDRLNWLRFLGFDLGAATPDANTIRTFREGLTKAEALETIFADFDWQLKAQGYLPMGGQIVDATLVATPKQRNTEAERTAVKEGKTAAEIWPGEPAKAREKDTDARWTLKFAKARPTADGRPQLDIAIPSFGYKSSISICRAFGLPIRFILGPGQQNDMAPACDLIRGITANKVLADRAYDADRLHDLIYDQDGEPVIPPRRHRKFLHSYDPFAYKQRWAIERFFAKLKQWRRIATRYATTSLASSKSPASCSGSND